MRQAERDGLLERQTLAMEEVAVRLAALQREEPPVLSRLRPVRERLTEAYAGWTQVVPASHLDGKVVRCPCGSSTELRLQVPQACAGGCGRWFHDSPQGVMVRRFGGGE